MFEIIVVGKNRALHEEHVYSILDEHDISDVTTNELGSIFYMYPKWFQFYEWRIAKYFDYFVPMILERGVYRLHHKIHDHYSHYAYSIEIRFDHEDDMKLFLRKKPRYLKCLS